MTLRLKRAYAAAEPADGQRILIDRLWPRGLTKEKAAIDEWMKEIAPSTELRKWFGHDAQKWPEFQKRYHAELKGNPLLAELKARLKAGPVTLVYSAKDEEHNDAIVLRQLLEGRLK